MYNYLPNSNLQVNRFGSSRVEQTGTDDIKTRAHVTSLERGLLVMEIPSAHPAGLTLTEVARQAGLTRAGARRFLHTLVTTGYASESERRFRLTPRILSMARTFVGGASLWRFAEPFMQEVSDRLNESCSAAVLSGEDAVYVARVAGRRIMSVGLHVGTRLPAYCTSMGRVLLSELGEAELQAFLDNAALEARTPKTVTDTGQLFRIIRTAGRKGFSIVDEELESGLCSIAVPVRDTTGRIVAAVNVSTQAGRRTHEELENEVLPILSSAASRIETYFAVQ